MKFYGGNGANIDLGSRDGGKGGMGGGKSRRPMKPSYTFKALQERGTRTELARETVKKNVAD